VKGGVGVGPGGFGVGPSGLPPSVVDPPVDTAIITIIAMIRSKRIPPPMMYFFFFLLF